MQFTLLSEIPGFKAGEVIELKLDEDGRYRHESGFWMDRVVLEANRSFENMDNPPDYFYVTAKGTVDSLTKLPRDEQDAIKKSGNFYLSDKEAQAVAQSVKVVRGGDVKAVAAELEAATERVK